MSPIIRIESFPEENGPQIVGAITRYTGMYGVDELLAKLPVEIDVEPEGYEDLKRLLDQLGCIAAYAGFDFSRFPVTIRGRTIEIQRDLVRVTEMGVSGEQKWEEPVSAFRGVLRRTDKEDRHVVTGPWSSATVWVTVHRVELVHPDSGKTLRLYLADTDEGIRKVWRDTARALDLPAVDETTDGIVTYAPEDLDKSIPELAAEGKVLRPVNADAPPPKGITRERVHGEVHLTIGAVKLERNAIEVAIAGFVLVLVFHIFGLMGSALPYALGAIILILGGSAFADMIVSRRIVITPREVRYFRKSPFGTFGLKAIPLNELKSVRRISITWIRGPVGRHDDKLVMESDTATISIGRLGEHQLRWLEQFILAASIDAPRL